MSDHPSCWNHCKHCETEYHSDQKPGKVNVKRLYRICTLHNKKTYETCLICTDTTYVRKVKLFTPPPKPAPIQRSEAGWEDF